MLPEIRAMMTMMKPKSAEYGRPSDTEYPMFTDLVNIRMERDS